MKSLYISIALIVIVIIFLGVNFFVTDNVLKETGKMLYALPESSAELEKFPGTEKIINSIDRLWQKKEQYFHISLEHKMSRDFYEELIAVKKNVEEKLYAEAASGIALLKDRLEYIRFNESAKFGNVM